MHRLLIAAFVMWQLPAASRPSFEMVQPELFGAVGGQANAWADPDNDGDLDYFVAFRGRSNRFYRNYRRSAHDRQRRVVGLRP